MCERNNLFRRDISRRSVFKAAAAGAAVVALPAGLASFISPAYAAGTTLKATHGTGFCNLGLFVAAEEKLTEVDDVAIEFVVTPSNAEITTMFGAGLVDMSMIPYSNFMTLYDAGAPVKIVAGGGVEGCIIVAGEGINSAADLKGKTIGTFQADTLEVLPYDYLKKQGMTFADVDVRYMNTSPELAQAFIAGAVDAMCHVEPYATQALNARSGSKILSDGTDIYGKGYSDCVLAVRSSLLESNPQAVKAVIKGMMRAQASIEEDIQSALNETVGSYYKTSMEAAKNAAKRQPVVVDQRNQTKFIIGRGQSMLELGYVRKVPDEGAFDWRPLEAVIADNADLYGKLRLKSA